MNFQTMGKLMINEKGKCRKFIALSDEDFWDYFNLLTDSVKEMYAKLGFPRYSKETETLVRDQSDSTIIAQSYRGVAVVREKDAMR